MHQSSHHGARTPATLVHRAAKLALIGLALVLSAPGYAADRLSVGSDDGDTRRNHDNVRVVAEDSNGGVEQLMDELGAAERALVTRSMRLLNEYHAVPGTRRSSSSVLDAFASADGGNELEAGCSIFTPGNSTHVGCWIGGKVCCIAVGPDDGDTCASCGDCNHNCS